MSKHNAIVTGAGSGIGRATSIALARAGYGVALVGRREEKLRETERLLPEGSRCAVIVRDVSEHDAGIDVVARAIGALGTVDALINNAGIGEVRSIEQTPPSEFDRIMRTNAGSAAYLTHAMWPLFKQQKRGCIVNVASMAVVDPFDGFFAYGASKAAMSLMTLSADKEGRGHGISAYCVAPGAVETEMLRASFDEKMVPRSASVSADQVAELIVSCVRGHRTEDRGRTIACVAPTVRTWLEQMLKANPGLWVVME
jgi:3-oxoacyl-[acyl-carrier protein] reductase